VVTKIKKKKKGGGKTIYVPKVKGKEDGVGGRKQEENLEEASSSACLPRP